MTLTSDRPLTAPYSHEAETAVLGALLLAPELAASEVMDVLDAADFYQPHHQQIFEAITDLYATEPTDRSRDGQRAAAGGRRVRAHGRDRSARRAPR